MSLASGQSLSFYEILGRLGAGAMGEVYRARDTRLDREVAIKILPVLFSGEYAARGATGLADYDVHPDRERFLMVRERAGDDGGEIKVVLGWFADVAGAAPEHD